MINDDGKAVVFLAMAYEYDSEDIIGIYSTREGAIDALEKHGFTFTTAGRYGVGWENGAGFGLVHEWVVER